MFLKHANSGDMVEILELVDLFDPSKSAVSGRFHRGEEMPDPEIFTKAGLVFPSGEALPRCWTDADYRMAG